MIEVMDFMYFYTVVYQDVLTGLTGPISGSRYTGSIYYSQ